MQHILIYSLLHIYIPFTAIQHILVKMFAILLMFLHLVGDNFNKGQMISIIPLLILMVNTRPVYIYIYIYIYIYRKTSLSPPTNGSILSGSFRELVGLGN